MPEEELHSQEWLSESLNSQGQTRRSTRGQFMSQSTSINQANIFDRHIYCVGSLESSPNTPVLEKNSDLEIYLESQLSVGQSQRSVALGRGRPGGRLLLHALLEWHPKHHRTARSMGRWARGSLPAAETLLFLASVVCRQTLPNAWLHPYYLVIYGWSLNLFLCYRRSLLENMVLSQIFDGYFWTEYLRRENRAFWKWWEHSLQAVFSVHWRCRTEINTCLFS